MSRENLNIYFYAKCGYFYAKINVFKKNVLYCSKNKAWKDRGM